ncbi:TnsD family Tn7-like transposition protein [Metallibacterium sp.]|uniref:TnsD family Tn7-like transposition protein n=1 Tax=Metallibacterium sp. TaxID=2940281 RepID=UPI00260D82A9|nr:TnsD family Tn7-like transposition protein [Metallibacterium sp.]
MQDGLFKPDPALLSWLPGETLFSLCSRHHRLWGYATSGQSAGVLFGGRRTGTQHDFPSALDEFERRTAGCHGTATDLARHRTLLRYYRPFLQPDEVANTVEQMRSRSVAHLKFRLGLLTSRFRANHPLKACPTCMQTDLAKEGWIYWHLQHQFPGVWACPWHAEPLLTSTVKSTGVERFLWHLPAQDRLVRGGHARSSAGDALLHRLAQLSVTLVKWDADDGWLGLTRLQPLFFAQAARRGWVSSAGSLRLKQAAPDYLAHGLQLRHVAEFAGLAKNLEEANVQVGRLFRSPQTDTHPLRLVLAIDWLFGDSQSFFSYYEDPSDPEQVMGSDLASGADRDRPDPRADRRARLFDLLGSGHSASAAAQQIGIDVATAMAWAAAADIHVKRRPKILKGTLWAQLAKDLRRGADKASVAARHGVSIPTVTRVLRNEVGLHVAWTSARTTKARDSARGAWQKLLQTYPDLGTKLLRAMNPSAYAWLYRNDRTWLAEHAPRERVTFPARRKSGVRWDERDVVLSSAVRRAVLQLAQDRPPKLLRLWQIVQAVPELSPKLAVLHRLPLTKRALDDALTRRRSPHEQSRNLFE